MGNKHDRFTMRCHKPVRNRRPIFQATLDQYYYGKEKIRNWGWNLVRRLLQQPLHHRRKGHIHARLGIAVDIDPDRNGLNIPRRKRHCPDRSTPPLAP
ncbi:MAG: hypothetical protein ACLSUW_01755 [Akkermansia sp.]